jgi:SAM-dependent methyltransferase
MSNAATPLYVRLLSCLVSPLPNFDFGFIKPLRNKAATLLQLRPGSRVIDAGCGSGASFPYLVAAIGSTGEVVGIEISQSSASHARRRAASNGWKNVEVFALPAQEVVLTEKYDGLLMFAAPDIYASPEALDRILPYLAERARIVFFGGKTSTRRFGWLLNGALNLALTKLSLPTTPGLDPKPWSLLAPHVEDLQLEEYFYGWMFLASATLASTKRDA